MLQTYSSRQEAQANGRFVTHTRHCGGCSHCKIWPPTLKILIQSAKVHFARNKAFLTRRKPKNVIEAWDSPRVVLRFGQPILGIQVKNAYIKECFFGKESNNNGGPPDCKINECLQCDEDKSGPLFKQFTGRTRRRSGLLSSIDRSCDSIYLIDQQACPGTRPVDE
jgi:hypothetical protein